MNLALISDVLETHEGRDKFLKTLSYAAKLATVFTKSPECTKKFRHFGSKMSECRVILRLMDDIPIVHGTIAYGWGTQDLDRTSRYLKVLRNLVDLISSPIEHICWMGEQKLVATNQNFWDDISIRLWIVYLNLSLFISCRKLLQIHSEKHHQFDHSSSKCKFSMKKTESRELIDIQLKNQILTCLRLSLDLSYAVSYLPICNLWGWRLKTWQVGLLGTASSMIGLYQLFKNRQQAITVSSSS